MKNLLLIFSLFCTNANVFSQRILYSSDEINKPYKAAADIVYIHPNSWTNKLIISKKHHVNEKIEITDKIWGYENEKGQIFRRFKGDFYLIKNMQGPIIIYFTQSDETYSSRGTHYYLFSTSLDAEMFYLNKKDLLQVFGTDKCFVDKIKTIKRRGNLNCQSEPELINKYYKDCH